MKTIDMIWLWFYRLVVGLAIFLLFFSVIFVVGMNTPHVRQSAGYTDATPEAVEITLSNSLPELAQEVRYCRASIGIGGRLRLYRFSAPVEDLHDHARKEFLAHHDQPEIRETAGVRSPITQERVRDHRSAFGVNADWMLAPSDAIGTIYEPADGRRSHRPIIFVDETHSVLYFQMTD